MRIRNKKSRWEGTVDDEGWQVLVRAGTSKNYEVIDKTSTPKVENIQLPEEVTKFQGRLQDKQKLEQQPAGKKEKVKASEQPTVKDE